MTDDAANVSFGGETLKATVANFGMAAVGFLGTIAFAILLGPRDFGGYTLLFTAVKFVDQPISGVAIATRKRFSGSVDDDAEVVCAQIAFSVAWIALSIGAAFVAASLLGRFTGLENAAVLFALLIGTVGFYEPLEALVTARGKTGAASSIDALRSMLTIPLQLAFVLAGLGPAGMVYGIGLATAMTIPVCGYYVGVRPTIPSTSTIRSVASYARYSIPSATVSRTRAQANGILIGTFLGPAAAGHYKVAAALTQPGLFVVRAVSMGLMSRVSNLSSRGKAYGEDVVNAMSFASVLSVPILFGAFAIPDQLIAFTYGTEYAPAAGFLGLMAAYRLLESRVRPMRELFDGLDRPDLTFRISVLSLGAHVLVGVLAVHRYDTFGVVFASVVGQAVALAVYRVVMVRDVLEAGWFERAFAEQLVAGVVMYAFVLAVDDILANSYVSLAILLLAGAGTYGLVLLALSEKFRVTARGILDDTGIDRYLPESMLAVLE